MTIQLFIFLFTLGSAVSSIFTEALKKALKDMPSNVIALINACVVGILGTFSAYILMGIEFTLPNIICIALMTLCIWVGSMVSYDKVMQTLAQLRG